MELGTGDRWTTGPGVDKLSRFAATVRPGWMPRGSRTDTIREILDAPGRRWAAGVWSRVFRI